MFRKILAPLLISLALAEAGYGAMKPVSSVRNSVSDLVPKLQILVFKYL
jgi:hypothetical protein